MCRHPLHTHTRAPSNIHTCTHTQRSQEAGVVAFREHGPYKENICVLKGKCDPQYETPSGLREIDIAPSSEETTMGSTSETRHEGGVGYRGLTGRWGSRMLILFGGLCRGTDGKGHNAQKSYEPEWALSGVFQWRWRRCELCRPRERIIDHLGRQVSVGKGSELRVWLSWASAYLLFMRPWLLSQAEVHTYYPSS